MNTGETSITILTYHSIDTSGSVISVAPETFAGHMACLAELGLRGVALRDAVNNRAAKGIWPTDVVVLTFDDGYANFFAVACPILRQHDFAATLFLVTRHVGGLNDWAAPPAGLGVQPMLSWEQVAELSAQGIEIAAHTQTHPNLPALSNAAAAEEIIGSRQDIEQRLAQRVESFAYPFGRISPAAEEVVRREFRAACTTELRRAREDPSARLPRVDAYYLQSVDTMRRLLSGQLDGYLTMRRIGRRVRDALTAPA